MRKSKCIAIIPARGGSKRIPGKNIKLFNGRPIISYAINEALTSKIFDRVLVSTDCRAIADVAVQYGAEVPFFRPRSLSDDYTNTGKVVDHVLQELRLEGEMYDFCCTIYATSPFLKAKYLKQGVAALIESDAVYSFAATTFSAPVHRSFEITKNGRARMFWPEYFSIRSQDLPEAYQDAGQFYWKRLQFDRKIPDSENIFSELGIPVKLPRSLVQDIDTIEDWELAELMYRALQLKTKTD